MMQAPGPYDLIAETLVGEQRFAWLQPLLRDAEQTLRNAPHGDLPRWLEALDALPPGIKGFGLVDGLPCFGARCEDQENLRARLQALHPWRKGPLQLAGVCIDTEWRSDWKWQRIEPHIDIRGHRILDVGCGNGYYGWRMLGQGAESVVGVDPTLVYAMQWLACVHFAGASNNIVMPLGIEDLPAGAGGFDTVCSMGVLYHRKDPVSHLRRLLGLGRPSAQTIIETLILDQPGEALLEPTGRYARMRNVHHVPTIRLLERWMMEAGFESVDVLDVTRTTVDEQRSTEWMSFQSLADCLDPEDPERTIEGYPAPTRAALLVSAPG